MIGLKILGAALVLSAFLATPASAWEAISEPAAAAASDPNFSIYSNDGRGFSRSMASEVPLGGASGPYMSVRPHRGNHAAGIKRH
jgi:hypothetical protein